MSLEWLDSRGVVERIYIVGQLVLDTPTHFGNGDTKALTDIPLLRDPLDGRSPLLTGASLAGALRNYLREYKGGYGVSEPQTGAFWAEQIFGYLRGREATVESWLVVDDAVGQFPPNFPIEIRDGVVIDPKTRTAEIDERGKGKKFDIELLSAGTNFPVHFELWLPEGKEHLLEALAIALKGLEDGKIGLGMRKRRGYGRCHVTGWQVQRYKMNQVAGLLGWLTYKPPTNSEYKPNILQLLSITPTEQHQGEAFRLEATFRLNGSLLIRSDTGEANSADMVHLHSWRNGEAKPVLSGTSLAGAIRSRAFRIANTLKGEKVATDLIDGMFGKRIRSAKDDPSGSRVLIQETLIQNAIDDRVQSRVKLDRFTGGAYPQALFTQQPLFGKSNTPTRVKIQLELRKPVKIRNSEGNLEEFSPQRLEAEVGLLLLVLKDLWTGDLPLGGESSVGRGRLQGETATLSLGQTSWMLTQSSEGKLTLEMDSKPANLADSDLENVYLKALKEWK